MTLISNSAQFPVHGSVGKWSQDAPLPHSLVHMKEAGGVTHTHFTTLSVLVKATRQSIIFVGIPLINRISQNVSQCRVKRLLDINIGWKKAKSKVKSSFHKNLKKSVRI